MQSQAFLEGIELAAELKNQAGGINGRKIQVISEDAHNMANKSNSAARKLISADQVAATIISSNLDAMASGPIFEKAQVPALVLWDASPEIDSLGHYIFSIGPWIPSSGQAATRFANKKLKAKTAVILWPKSINKNTIKRSL